MVSPPQFLLSFDSKGKPAALKSPAGWDKAVPGGMQPPAVFLASDLHHPASPAAQPRWQEPRRSSAGLLWFCWSCWRRNDLWVTHWFGQIGRLSLGKLPGVLLGRSCAGNGVSVVEGAFPRHGTHRDQCVSEGGVA